MSGINLDHGAARAALRSMLKEGEEQRRRHASSFPEFSAAEAGRDFSDRGEAIARMLLEVHATGGRHVEELCRLAAAGAEEVAVYGQTDEQSASDVAGIA